MAVLTSTRNLFEAILDSGIQNTNYFNGRILNAGDLQTDQDANREQHEQLGLAIGAGVVQGLWVELVSNGSDGNPPVVSVSRGLALNGKGQAVALPVDVKLALTPVTTPQPVDAGLFADCQPPSSTPAPLQAGIYVLVATPASGYFGQAPMYSFGDVNTATGCGSRYAVEGVRFQRVQLDITKVGRLSQATQTAIAQLMTQTDAASLSKLRNWIAHICFGTEQVVGFVADPFARPNNQSPYLHYGAVDALVASGALTTADVPLALLYWTVQGVQFLDRWSVRRRPVPPLLTTTWPLPISRRQKGEREAVFLQFEEQLQALLTSGAPQATFAAIHAGDYFRYLPAAGFLPIAGGSFGGFTTAAFFTQEPHRDPEFVDGEILGGLFHAALAYPPRDTNDGELVWLYRTWQNAKAIDDGAGIQPFVVFAAGQLRHMALARLDLARWNYSNYPD